MDNLLAFSQEDLFFGENIPTDVRLILQGAIDAYEQTEKAESLLLEALQRAPDQLEVYIALYKFYFYKKRLDDAQRIVQLTLKKAAELGGFPPEWDKLTPRSADWSLATGEERVYLFTLKALAFIRLRLSDLAGAEAILLKLQDLDPQDQVGSSVISGLADGLKEAANG
jgi:tetratricopeptide (TPR) repeat protein